jgi:hypothetical protein
MSEKGSGSDGVSGNHTGAPAPLTTGGRRYTDEAFARDLRELRLWLEAAKPVHMNQGRQVATLNFYWMNKFQNVAKEAEARLAEPLREAAQMGR